MFGSSVKVPNGIVKGGNWPVRFSEHRISELGHYIESNIEMEQASQQTKDRPEDSATKLLQRTRPNSIRLSQVSDQLDQNILTQSDDARRGSLM